MERGANAIVSQRGNQRLVANLVQAAGHRQRWTDLGNRDAVCQFAIVQDRSAAAGPANGRAMLTGQMLLPIVERLEIAERKRRLLPLIETKRGLAPGGR